jgi:hypothetical protein
VNEQYKKWARVEDVRERLLAESQRLGLTIADVTREFTRGGILVFQLFRYVRQRAAPHQERASQIHHR